MLNYIWAFFIIISTIFAFFSGKIDTLNNSIFESTNTAVQLCITLFGSMCLWNGIMKIASTTSFVLIINKILRPIMKILFPKINANTEIYNEITMNIVANILGLGNASTPLGLKAMKSLQEKNFDKNVLNDDMSMFIVLNTASIQLIPTTVIAIRNSLGSSNPTVIIFPVWIATICAAIAGITATKFFIKIEKNKFIQ